MTKIPTDDENFFKCVQQVEELFDGMPPLQSSSRLCKGKKSGESNREKKVLKLFTFENFFVGLAIGNKGVGKDKGRYFTACKKHTTTSASI